MRSSHVRTIAASACVAVLSIGVSAQQTTQVHPGKGGSPHVRSEWTVDGAKISVTYGRPSLKGRTIGKEVAPFGRVWRTGADEATTFSTDKPLTIGSLSVPAGIYTLYTLPGESEWQLIVNKKTGQWGTEYPEGQDLGRVPLKVEAASKPAEQLTIAVEDTSAGGTLTVSWGTTTASVPFTVG